MSTWPTRNCIPERNLNLLPYSLWTTRPLRLELVHEESFNEKVMGVNYNTRLRGWQLSNSFKCMMPILFKLNCLNLNIWWAIRYSFRVISDHQDVIFCTNRNSFPTSVHTCHLIGPNWHDANFKGRALKTSLQSSSFYYATASLLNVHKKTIQRLIKWEVDQQDHQLLQFFDEPKIGSYVLSFNISEKSSNITTNTRNLCLMQIEGYSQCSLHNGIRTI